MPICQGKLSDGKTCPITVGEGKTFCRWHDPEDESWREIYERLEKVSLEEKTNIVLWLINEHPGHRLIWPERNGVSADLINIDLGRETLEKRIEQSGIEDPTWWSTENQGANLAFANLQDADLRGAKLQGVDLLSVSVMSNVYISDAVKLISGFFAIAGIFLAGLLGFVAGNRIRRS